MTTNGRGNRDRWRAFLSVLEEAKSREGDFITLPGGFFRVHSLGTKKTAANRIFSEAQKHGIAVAVGVDVVRKRQPEKGRGGKLTAKDGKLHEMTVRRQKISSFVVCWSRASRRKCWRQRSTTCKDQIWVPTRICLRSQEVSVNNLVVEVLSCGEIFNKRIRGAIINRKARVDTVVDLAHAGRGLRISPALRLFGRYGMSSFCSAHVNRTNAMKRAFNNRGVDISSRDSDINIPCSSRVNAPPPRIEMKICEL